MVYFLLCSVAEMLPARIGNAHERQHNGDFRQHADGRRESCGARHAEQRDARSRRVLWAPCRRP